MKNLKISIILMLIFWISFCGISFADDLSLHKIGENIFCISYMEQNTGFFKFGKDIYVIDTFFETEIAEKQKKLILRNSLGFFSRTFHWLFSKFKEEKFGFLLNTNLNVDSIAGDKVFADGFNIVTGLSAREYLIENRDSVLSELDEKDQNKIELIPADIAFDKTLRIYHDDDVVEIIDVQNVYNRGNLIVNFKGESVIFAGLLFFNKIIPDLKGAKLRDYQRELGNIMKINPAKIVPRYGSVGSYDDFLLYKEYIDTLISETQKFVKKGSSIEDTLDNVKLEKFKDWEFYSERHPVNIQRTYNQLKNENNQILEFLKAIQQQKTDK